MIFLRGVSFLDGILGLFLHRDTADSYNHAPQRQEGIHPSRDQLKPSKWLVIGWGVRQKRLAELPRSVVSSHKFFSGKWFKGHFQAQWRVLYKFKKHKKGSTKSKCFQFASVRLPLPRAKLVKNSGRKRIRIRSWRIGRSKISACRFSVSEGYSDSNKWWPEFGRIVEALSENDLWKLWKLRSWWNMITYTEI